MQPCTVQKLLDMDRRPNGIATSFGRKLLTDERLDALLGRLDENKGSDFSKLESA
jgi:hypothetical protein